MVPYCTNKSAMSYEVKLRNSPWKESTYERWQEMSRIEERSVRNEWEQNRQLFQEKYGYSVREVENRR